MLKSSRSRPFSHADLLQRCCASRLAHWYVATFITLSIVSLSPSPHAPLLVSYYTHHSPAQHVLHRPIRLASVPSTNSTVLLANVAVVSHGQDRFLLSIPDMLRVQRSASELKLRDRSTHWEGGTEHTYIARWVYHGTRGSPCQGGTRTLNVDSDSATREVRCLRVVATQP